MTHQREKSMRVLFVLATKLVLVVLLLFNYLNFYLGLVYSCLTSMTV